MNERLESPVWLSEEPEVLTLLHAALDRFDEQPAGKRERDVSLPVERFLTSLARGDAAADQLWKLVGALEAQGVVRIKHGRVGPFDPRWKSARVAFGASSEAILREWLNRQRSAHELARWREAVRASSHHFADGGEVLLTRRFVVAGLAPEEVVSALARIGTVKGPITLRQLSALCFRGDSKVLDERGDLVATLFPRLVLRERVIVVPVYLPERVEGVLFIENQDTYTAACGGSPVEAANLALVFASGFRSSAERVRSRTGAILHFAGPGDFARGQFERWWFDQADPPGPCAFWGDLDFAGMQILRALRSRFGCVSAWRPGYDPMLTVLRSEGGYSSTGAPGRGQVDPGGTGCAYADAVLLPEIRKRGQLDQERPVEGDSLVLCPGHQPLHQD